MMTFSERTMRHLRAVMDKQNISQRDLARELDVSEARVSQIFREGSNLTLKTIDDIEAALVRILTERPPNNFVFIG